MIGLQPIGVSYKFGCFMNGNFVTVRLRPGFFINYFMATTLQITNCSSRLRSCGMIA